MDTEKKHVILTTKKKGKFAVSTKGLQEDELLTFAAMWAAKMNEKYAGTDFEVISWQPASDEEMQDFKSITSMDSTSEGE